MVENTRKVCAICGKARPWALHVLWRSRTRYVYICKVCNTPGWSERLLAKEAKEYGTDE